MSNRGLFIERNVREPAVVSCLLTRAPKSPRHYTLATVLACRLLSAAL